MCFLFIFHFLSEYLKQEGTPLFFFFLVHVGVAQKLHVFLP
jgi:hypothetical protein